MGLLDPDGHVSLPSHVSAQDWPSRPALQYIVVLCNCVETETARRVIVHPYRALFNDVLTCYFFVGVWPQAEAWPGLEQALRASEKEVAASAAGRGGSKGVGMRSRPADQKEKASDESAKRGRK